MFSGQSNVLRVACHSVAIPPYCLAAVNLATHLCHPTRMLFTVTRMALKTAAERVGNSHMARLDM